MAEINALIPMSYRSPTFPTAQSVQEQQQMQYRNQLAAMQVQDAQRQNQTRNALLDVFRQPGAMDQKTGMPTLASVGKVMAIDPDAGLKLQNNLVRMQQEQQAAQTNQIHRRLLEWQINGAQAKALTDISVQSQVRYDGLIKSGVPAAQAAQIVGKERLEKVDELGKSGQLSPEQITKLRNPFDPQANQAFIAASPAYQNLLKERKGETTPFQKELAAFQKMKKGDPGYDEMKARIEKETGNIGGISLPTNPYDHGDAYLKTLAPNVATTVKALADGRMAFPSGFALRSPYWQQMIQAVAQYDPSFDAVNYNARAKTRADFTSGKSSQSINAMNTVIGHLDTLSKAADALKNTSIPAWNSVANLVASNLGDPRVKQFDTTKKAVVDELTRVWRGTGGSEGDIKTWSEQLNAANSPAQLHAVIAQMGDLLESKLSSLRSTYEQGMGTTAKEIQLVTPKSRKTLDRLEGRASKATGKESDHKAAPASALEYLKAHPEVKDQFKAKYGYLPNGS